jgi:sec-independent protein translocase protein TatC
MANAPETGRFPEAEEGGPVKSFLEHLEDLRWALIKCAAAIGLGVLICLLAGNHVVAILLRPLQQARVSYSGSNQVVTIFFGTNRLGTFDLDPAHEALFDFDTNRSSPLFSATDIVGLRTLSAKLKLPAPEDRVSQYLSTNLSPQTKDLLEHYQAGWWFLPPFKAADSPALRRWLSEDLDHIIQEGPIYDAGRFAGVKIPEQISEQVALNPQGLELVRLNQQLLLQAYPRELSKNHERFLALDLVPIPGTNGTKVLGFQVNTNVDAAEQAQHVRTSVNAFGPAKAFLIGFHVAVYAGIALASPFILLFVGQFVLPALRIRERKYLYRGLAFAIPLFLSGVLFCYFILMPAALAASQVYSDWFGFSSNYWDAGDYINFVCKFMLGMGLGFELPVVVLVLVKIGLLSYSSLSKARPYMIVINLILGAVLTTPEVFTQVLMAVPLQLLFEISVWIAWYWERQEKKRAAAEETGAVV